MGNVIKMRRLHDGLRLSPEIAQLIRVLLTDDPLPKRSRSVPRIKPANETSVNQFGVKPDQVWESMDPRDLIEGAPRQLKVVEVGDTHAVLENLRTGVCSAVLLKRFAGRTKKDFKLVVPLRPPAFAVVHA